MKPFKYTFEIVAYLKSVALDAPVSIIAGVSHVTIEPNGTWWGAEDFQGAKRFPAFHFDGVA